MMQEETPVRTMTWAEALEWVAAEARLSGRQREAWLLRYRENWPLHLIAEHLGVQVGTVSSHLDRAAKKIERASHRSAYRELAAALWEAYRGNVPSAPLAESLPAARVVTLGDFEDVLARRDGRELQHAPWRLSPQESRRRRPI